MYIRNRRFVLKCIACAILCAQMSAKQSKANKVMQVFRIRPDLVVKLSKESSKTNVNKTRIVEMALAEWFKIKRPA